MLKFLLIISATVTTTASAIAAPKWDSVAVFHRPEKVLIQINEGGAAGRLQTFMNALGVQDSILLVSPDQSFRLDCARNERAVNCALRMVPSAQVVIEGRSVSAKYPVTELGVQDLEFPEISFLNSNGDHLRLQISAGNFELVAGKK